MSVIKSQVAFFTQNKNWAEGLKQYDPLNLNAELLEKNNYNIQVFICDLDVFNDLNYAHLIHKKRKNKEFQKVVLALDQVNTIQADHFNLIKPDKILSIEKFSETDLINLFSDIQQTEQDQAYIHLSAELNSEYEIIKKELELKLVEKTKNLIESRRQIFEINNRVEFLRKTLYITSKVKNLSEAEQQLNDLLAQYNKITWLKIISKSEVEKFEFDLEKNQLDMTFFRGEISLDESLFYVYFFKGDKKIYKKQDQDYFKKLCETLQINLSRSINLQSLLQSERLFDLAFHSSPHYIIVIDRNYQVLQANLAAEKASVIEPSTNKCYELLFQRTSPCVGCKLGENFQIQHDNKTFRTQSSSFSINPDDTNKYWIHLYEDISEQKSIENKFQQTARLTELGLISSSIAHELNNPLGGILSYLQIMKLDLPISHPFQADIELMNKTALRMKTIIEDLLVFSRKDDSIQVLQQSLTEIVNKNIDLIQLQLKKENLKVVFNLPNNDIFHEISTLHFRNSIHLVFQFLLQKLKVKKANQSNFTGLVEVKIFQDQMNSYLSFSSNLGPHVAKENTNDLTLITLEKSLIDQGFQAVISEPKISWIQVLFILPIRKPDLA